MAKKVVLKKTAPKKSASVKVVNTKTTAPKVVKSSVKVGLPKFNLKSAVDSTKSVISKRKAFFTNLVWVLATVVALMLVDLFVQYINNDFSAAVVNNRRITLNSLQEKVMARAGDQILLDMIREELISQAAKDAGVEVSEDELNQEYDRIAVLYDGEEQLLSALDANGYTKKSYLDSLRLELLANKVLVEEPTEEALQTFFTENKEQYFATQDSYEDDAENVKRTYVQVEFQSKVNAWLQDLEAKATIQNNLTTEPSYGFFKATRNIITNLYNQIVTNTK